MRSILAVLACVAAATCAQATCAHAADTVDVGEGDGRLNAVLYRPQGAGPFQVVLGLHGCGGMMNRSGKIVRRYADWGERLSKAGIAALFLDSYTPRGLGPQCRVREGRRSRRDRIVSVSWRLNFSATFSATSVWMPKMSTIARS